MVDYSKWNNIEISDDEDDTHPNIDTPSLFRWRHKARIERMEQHQREKEEFEKSKQLHKQKLESTQEKLLETEKQGDDISELRKVLDELELEDENLKKQEKDLYQKEKVTPWNVDTISKPGFTKTVVNKTPERREEHLSVEEQEKRLNVFFKENEKALKKFGMLQKYNDSKQFLLEHPHLVCEDTATYLVIWCINLEIEEKTNLVRHVAHQSVCLKYILEQSKLLQVDPRACVAPFFSVIQIADPEYKQAFSDEVEALIERVRESANKKLEEAVKVAKEEKRQARLGPGGLDPFEVFESLPESLKACFESEDVGLLHETLAKMPTEDAIYHMKRCVDSGLWDPNKNKDKVENKDDGSATTAGDGEQSFAQ